MSDDVLLMIFLAVWLVTLGFVMYRQLRHGTVDTGLVFTYLFQLSLIHMVAAVVHVMPWYIYPVSGLAIVLAGFEQATYGLVAFSIGLALVAPFVINLLHLDRDSKPSIKLDPRLPRIYLVIGLVSYFVISPLITQVPTVTALVAACNQLMLVGMCLGIWQAWQNKDRTAFIIWLVLSALMPFLTIVVQGFLGFGVAAFATVLAFMAVFVHPRRRLILAGILMTFLGLSFYVTYFRDRSELRALVWGGLPFTDRVAGVLNTVSSIEWFNPFNQDHLGRIDGRLNQNYIVGVAVINLQSGNVAYANGATIWDAALALIPRVFWPDKPIVAGSGDIVTQFTGIPFAVGTSVGVGQVMEFFINFGTAGVVIGFMLIGSVIGVLDFVAGKRLREGNWESMVLWYLPGLALLQTGGSLAELTSTLGASIIVALLINHVALPLIRSRRPVSQSLEVTTDVENI